MMAAWSGHEAVVHQLLAAGARADVEDALGETPLFKAVKGGWEEVVEILLATERVDCNSRNTVGRTPLSRAAQDGYIEVVKLLLAGGADPDIADDNGKIPLQWAEEYGNETLADLLRD
ncbi:ankyrin repeat protein [Ilyonectria sp. MPI-CAGE-AT-0026]|nr:ankyrin repeat protein [Ilyonectria sp. MPI-CAGE-AT-0026]